MPSLTITTTKDECNWNEIGFSHKVLQNFNQPFIFKLNIAKLSIQIIKYPEY